MTTTISRRAVLAGVAALPALGATAVAATAVSVDPIFAAIEAHRQLSAESNRLYDALDTAEGEARAEHGVRPFPLISWRNFTIGASEIDHRREVLLEQPRVNRKRIEREYLDAKARYAEQVRAGHEWDERAGIAPLHAQNAAAARDAAAALSRAVRMKPQTAAGAAALIAYLLEDMDQFEEGPDWHRTALRTVRSGLEGLAAQS